MLFDHLMHIIPRLKDASLPGQKAHQLIMDLAVRNQIFQNTKFNEPPKPSAVLALIYPGQSNNAEMIFILRKTYNGHHSGQISFPGGKMEPEDNSLMHTALRETNEEIGIKINEIDVVKQLTPLYIPVSNYYVTPFLAMMKTVPEFRIDPLEVESVFSIPLKDIINNPLIDYKKEYFGKMYKLKAFQFEKLRIWGATAMILSEIVALFEKNNVSVRK
jgi:8-oxo-dGTP pyrophosphatase MutT (NUDIX family)